ncbi:MAG: PLD nuclease N-terminal domain-containing protein [Gulosibacter sp.]|uniref:PLD nuclease N-terminal domain-containing protein n=1 Tax=Gulosibacter sp. TaxID=2817531 RepID=UPI003F91C212
MSRALIIGIVVAVALTIYAVVDCAMFDAKRTKVMQKPIWLVVILLIPVIGPLLWMFIGKGSGEGLGGRQQPQAPPDDLNFIADRKSDSEHDARIAELEEQMRLLDEEIERDRQSTMRNHPSNHTGTNPIIVPEDHAPKDAGDDSDDGDDRGDDSNIDTIDRGKPEAETEDETNGDDEGRRQ